MKLSVKSLSGEHRVLTGSVNRNLIGLMSETRHSLPGVSSSSSWMA